MGMLACTGRKTHDILLLPLLRVYLAHRTRPGTETLNRLWLDGWVDGRTDGQTDGVNGGRMNEMKDGWIDEWVS